MFRQDYAQLSIFSGLDGNQISQISPFFIDYHFEKDAVIFEQGQPARYLYILFSGDVVINYKPYDGPLLTVAHIAPGGVFGWSAALGRDIYTSGATAAAPSTACCVRGSDLAVIRAQYPETGKILLERLAGVIAERLASTHNQVLGILTRGVGA
jgi:CRP/FNR family transcriptional regulator, cyclic AMP receptor protein